VLALVTATLALAAPANAMLLECDRGDAPAAAFEARMGTVPGAAAMQMRFTLQAATPTRSSYRRVAAPGFGTWTTSDPGTTRYVYTRRVENLVGPASYRVVVRFRWLDAAGEQVARARRVSRVCRQPDNRPNLTIAGLSVEQTADPTARRYVAHVRNTGRRTAEPFELVIGDLEPVIVGALPPGRDRAVEVTGPACRDEITAVADPDDVIDERYETDNELTADC
jgi:CARDB protein